MQNSFQFNESPDVFTPKDLVELGRPGAGVANHAGDLVLVPYSKYSFEEKKCIFLCIFPSMQSIDTFVGTRKRYSSLRWNPQFNLSSYL
jgi:hypothetical protein